MRPNWSHPKKQDRRQSPSFPMSQRLVYQPWLVGRPAIVLVAEGIETDYGGYGRGIERPSQR